MSMLRVIILSIFFLAIVIAVNGDSYDNKSSSITAKFKNSLTTKKNQPTKSNSESKIKSPRRKISQSVREKYKQWKGK